MRPMWRTARGKQVRGLRIILLMVGLGWLLVGSGRSAAQQTVTLEAYLSTIAQYRSQILRAGNNSQMCRDTMTAVANTLSQITAVQLPDGSVMRVDHQGAAQALQPRPCNPALADQYLSGLCPTHLCPVSRPLPPLRPSGSSQGSDSLAGAAGGSAPGALPPNAPPSDPPPVAPAIEAPGAEAGQPTTGDAPGEAPAETAGEAPAEAPDNGAGEDAGAAATLPEEGNSGEDSSSQPPALATNFAGNATPTAAPQSLPPAVTPQPTPVNGRQSVLLAFIVVVAVVLIGTAVVLLWKGQDEEEEPEKKTRSEAATAVNEGRQLVEKGDYREAVRRLFLAMLLTLDEKGLMPFDRHRTNLELLQQDRLHQAVIPSLRPIITTYERVWYGLEPLPADEYESLVSGIQALREWRLEAVSISSDS